jgi:hypothetical protein
VADVSQKQFPRVYCGTTRVVERSGGALTNGSARCELPHPTALGATRPSLVEGGASCFCVGIYTRRGHRNSRLRRRLPFTGGSECPTPTGWTLSHNRRCALLVALEHRRKCGEHRTTLFDCRGGKRGGERASNSCGRCIPSLLTASPLAEEGGLSALNSAKAVLRACRTEFFSDAWRLKWYTTPQTNDSATTATSVPANCSFTGVVAPVVDWIMPVISRATSPTGGARSQTNFESIVPTRRVTNAASP